MTMNKVPTLLVGLGGIGGRIAEQTYRMLSDEDKEYIGVVAIDTNIEDLKKLGVKAIQTSDERTVRKYLEDHPQYLNWFPANKYLLNRSITTGAGQIRALSRMAMLASLENGKFLPLEDELNRILRHNGEVEDGKVNIILTGSITGGTGAGLFLQMPYYIRHLLRQQMAIENVATRGVFLSSDLTVGVQPSKINKDAVMTNAYACIKELNALYLSQEDSSVADNIEFDFFEKLSPRERQYRKAKVRHDTREAFDDLMEDSFGGVDRWDPEDLNDVADIVAEEGVEIPYDAFYLIEGKDNTGTIGNTDLETLITHVGKMLFTTLFTPIKSPEEGVEINYVLSDMEGTGMNRYSSMGMTVLKYPYEQILEYITLRWVKDLIQADWSFLDDKYEQEKAEAEKMQRFDSSVVIPERKDVFTSLFKIEIEPGRGHRLGHLKSQVIVEGGTRDKTIDQADVFLSKIENRIESVLSSYELQEAEVDSTPNDDKLRQLDSARDEILRVEDELRTYQKLIEKTVLEHRMQVANEVFPVSMEAMRLSKDRELNLHTLLADLHPVAARYILYRLLIEIKQRIQSLDGQSESLNMDTFDETDYLGSDELGPVSASEAISILQDRHFSSIRAKGKGKGSLSYVARNFSKNVKMQHQILRKYAVDSITLSTYDILLERIEKLSDYYEEFFTGIRNKIQENEDRIKRLERTFENRILGIRPVYASTEALREAYERFKSTVSATLPPATSEKLFNRIYHITVNVLEDEMHEMTETKKKKRNEETVNALKALFVEAIYGSLQTAAIEKGDMTLNMSIRQALEKEFQLETGIYEDSERYAEKLLEYKRTRLNEAMSEATPMFAVKRIDDPVGTVYMAIHPDAADTMEGEPNAGVTRENLFPEVSSATDYKKVCTLMDSEFSRYEIICMKTKHKYMVTDLVKYGKNSDNESAYKKRVMNLGRKPSTDSLDAFKEVANPHINCFWHEEGYIPSLTAEERQAAHEDDVSAFVYAIGYDWVRFDGFYDRKGNFKDAWIFWPSNSGGGTPVFAKGRPVKNGFAQLYGAMKYNGRLKRMILTKARTQEEVNYGHMDAEDAMQYLLTDDEFIEDLTQSTGTDSSDDNILDVFLSMKHDMDKEEWTFLFHGLTRTLMHYLESIFDFNPRLVNRAYKMIVPRLYEYSVPGIKEKEDRELSRDERELKNEWEEMRKKEFD